MNSSLQENNKHAYHYKFVQGSKSFPVNNLHRYDTIIIYINLIEDLIDDFKTNFIVYYILQKAKQKLPSS